MQVFNDKTSSIREIGRRMSELIRIGMQNPTHADTAESKTVSERFSDMV